MENVFRWWNRSLIVPWLSSERSRGTEVSRGACQQGLTGLRETTPEKKKKNKNSVVSRVQIVLRVNISKLQYSSVVVENNTCKTVPYTHTKTVLKSFLIGLFVG